MCSSRKPISVHVSTAVGRAPNAVAVRGVATNARLAATDPDDVRVAWINGDRADRPAEVPVGDGLPIHSPVGGLVDSAAGRPHPVLVRTLWRAGDSDRAAATRGADFTPAQRIEERCVGGKRGGRGWLCGACRGTCGLCAEREWQREEKRQ